jgi:hypothetical protein
LPVVEKWGVLNRLLTSYEPFFSSASFPYSINIPTETEEEEYSIYKDIIFLYGCGGWRLYWLA